MIQRKLRCRSSAEPPITLRHVLPSLKPLFGLHYSPGLHSNLRPTRSAPGDKRLLVGRRSIHRSCPSTLSRASVGGNRASLMYAGGSRIGSDVSSPGGDVGRSSTSRRTPTQAPPTNRLDAQKAHTTKRNPKSSPRGDAKLSMDMPPYGIISKKTPKVSAGGHCQPRREIEKQRF
jgi:hypothetical protein